MKMFAILVGGEAPGANIEIHDMRFVVAPSVQETHDQLRQQWWGKTKSFHIDCWAEIDYADGYDITLRPEPFLGQERLFYVFLGGYNPSEFSEQHRSVFVVAETVEHAKARAIESARGWILPHRDDFYEADQAFALDEMAVDARLHIHLSKSQQQKEFRFTCDYTPIKELVA